MFDDSCMLCPILPISSSHHQPNDDQDRMKKSRLNSLDLSEKSERTPTISTTGKKNADDDDKTDKPGGESKKKTKKLRIEDPAEKTFEKHGSSVEKLNRRVSFRSECDSPLDVFIGIGASEPDWNQATRFNFDSQPREKRRRILSGDDHNDVVRNVDDIIFDMIRDDNQMISVAKFITILKNYGLKKSDPRLRETWQNFQRAQRARILQRDVIDPFNLLVDRESFKSCIRANVSLITRALKNRFVIPDWPAFCREIGSIYQKCKSITDGKVAEYIPQLARANPNWWGVSVCTVDGQRASWGDSKLPWCLQSVSKPLTYGVALNESGCDVVHNYIGQEPSGRLFNEICLDYNNRPHNPMINAGAIVIASLIKRDQNLADRFDAIMKVYKKLAGDEYVGFSNTTFLSERKTADRNFALAYYMREHKCFPEGLNLSETMDLYFQLCSIEVTCESASVIAATLANGGVCPITGETVFSSRSVRDVLSLMYSCGMYDYSGQFAFRVGLPAKSGVSGALILVIPKVMGFALWSPPLDRTGNTVRGVHFCEEIIERFNFHNYDILDEGQSEKVDPRKRSLEIQGYKVVNLLFAAANGDLEALKRYAIQGISVDLADYDGRTALHVAASEGHAKVVRFLLDRCNAKWDTTDRWGHTPLDDSRHFKHVECETILEAYIKSVAPASPILIKKKKRKRKLESR